MTALPTSNQKTVLSEVKRCTGMINERLNAIQVELDKGEEADYSLFRPSVSPREGVQLVAASKDSEEEKTQPHHRGR